MTDFDVNTIKRENLNRLLFEKGLTSSELANIMGVSDSYISTLRTGAANIGNKTLGKLCRVLGVDRQEFFEQIEIIQDKSETLKSAAYEAEHHRLILRFINKKWGLDTNRMLLEIERLDPSQLNTIQNLLKAFIETLRKEKKMNKTLG